MTFNLLEIQRVKIMQIREFSSNDFSLLLSLANDKWKAEIENTCKTLLSEKDNSYTKALLAFSEKELIGFIYSFILPNGTLLPMLLYVKPSHRGKGIAHELLKELEIQSSCELSMIFYSKSLHSFYAEQGYDAGDNLEVAIKNIRNL